MSVRAVPSAANNMIAGVSQAAIPEEAQARIGNLGMSPRQQALDVLWRFYRCINYDARKLAWDGSERLDHLETEVIATAGAVPPGFVDAGKSTVPLRFRRPTAPYYLVRIIVDRFTGLLFSQRRHPKVTVEGDPETEDFVNASIEVGRLWAQMIECRTFGGGMGTGIVGFSFAKGRPVFEVHDPRYATPVFKDRTTHELESIEIRKMYPDEVRDPQTGQWVEDWFWYRRVIDENTDTVWPKVPVGEGDEPVWAKWKNFPVTHGLGECPVEWIQNLPVQDTPDGDPDCHGTYDMVETIDALIAQSNHGILANCDPTFIISSDADLDAVTKGSGNAIKLLRGDSAQYLEIDGSGPKSAIELADKLEDKVLRMARCVIDQARSATSKTATEVDRDYSSMWEKADVLREQYGEKGVKRLLEKYLRAARLVSTRVEIDPETGMRVREKIVLPKRAVKQDDGTAVYVDRVLGEGEDATITLTWPDYTTPSLEDVGKAVTAAVAAFTGGVVDEEHAARFIQQYFQVEDVGAMLKKIKTEKAAADEAVRAQVAAQGMPPR